MVFIVEFVFVNEFYPILHGMFHSFKSAFLLAHKGHKEAKNIENPVRSSYRLPMAKPAARLSQVENCVQ